MNRHLSVKYYYLVVVVWTHVNLTSRARRRPAAISCVRTHVRPVVFFPPSTYTRRRDSIDSDDESGARYYYVRLDDVSSSDEDDDDDGDQRPTARGRRRRDHRRTRLILEVPDDDEEEESDDWDPCLHLGELPLRPMSRFHKAFIDVLFVVATVALEQGVFVWTALQQGGAADKVINWFLAVPVMRLAMIFILCLAAFVYALLVTSDFSWRPAPAPAPAAADENV